MTSISSSSGYIADAVDQYLAAKKRLQGGAAWEIGNRSEERRAVWSVMYENELHGTLQATAYPYEKELRYTLTLNLPPCIWRLDFDPDSKMHRNPRHRLSVLGNEAIVRGRSYHAWSDNRYLASDKKLPENLDCARTLNHKIRTWDQGFRWFCKETNIILTKDDIMDYPVRDTLI